MSRRASKEGCRPGRSSRQKVRVWLQAPPRAAPSRGGRAREGVWSSQRSHYRGFVIPASRLFSLFLCLFSVHLGVHCQTLFCSVSFLVLSFKADLKRQMLCRGSLTGGSACQTPMGLPAGLFGLEQLPHVEMSPSQWVCGSRCLHAPCCHCGLATKVPHTKRILFQGVHLQG